jgi:hypothetical protein
MKSSSDRLRLLACVVGAVAPALVSGVGPAVADEVFAAKTVVTLPGGQNINGFDISFFTKDRYYLGDRTNSAVDVIDSDSNSLVAQIGKGTFKGATGNNNTSGPDGVVVFNNQVWAGDGDSTVKVFNATTGAHITTIATGAATDFRADELCFDPRDELVMVANNAATPPYASIISTDDFTVKAKIKFDGTNGAPNSSNGAEQCQWDPRTGKFMISIPEIGGTGDNTHDGGVAVIDPKTMKVETTFDIPVAQCSAPQGMTLGPDHQVLLGCNGAVNANASTVVIDDRNGKVIQAFNNESGSDEVWFNPGDNHYFLARSSGVGGQFLGVIDAESLTEDTSVATNATGKGNVHSVAADPERNQVYVPIPNTATAGVCSSGGGSDTQGCIAVFTTKHDDKCFAEGSPVIRVSEDGDEDHMRDGCRRHHHDHD